MFRRKKVDVLIIRTAPCQGDSRVNKIIYHYKKIGIRIGVVCVSRSTHCKREDTESVKHVSINALDFNKLPRIIAFLIRVFNSYRIILAFDHILTSTKIKFKFNPRITHGCDLDGYLISRFAFPFQRRTIFEVYDPWSTMIDSARIRKLEYRAFKKAKVLIMPAEDSRIKVERDRSISMSNMVDPGLLEELTMACNSESQRELNLEDKRPYILTGGIIGEDTWIGDLIEVIGNQNRLKLVVASDTSSIKGNGFLNIPKNVYCIGKQDWPNWLYLLKNANAVWIFYSRENNHFKSHISPNKYWEACICNTTMLVNDLDQFCDRVSNEPKIIEVGEFGNREDLINQALSQVELSKEKELSNSNNISSFWFELELSRTEKIRRMLEWLK